MYQRSPESFGTILSRSKAWSTVCAPWWVEPRDAKDELIEGLVDPRSRTIAAQFASMIGRRVLAEGDEELVREYLALSRIHSD
jgi:hypothetical protein